MWEAVFPGAKVLSPTEMGRNMWGSFSDKLGLLSTQIRYPRNSGQPISDSPEMGERATGGGLGPAAMSVREALFSRWEVPRSLNRSPGLERRCTVLTWDSEGASVDRTIFGAPQGRKKLPARGGYPARPACGWEAGRHLVPQLRRGTPLRPFPHRQHARPPLRPRPFGPIVRAILS